jgi:hypothetical protein
LTAARDAAGRERSVCNARALGIRGVGGEDKQCHQPSHRPLKKFCNLGLATTLAPQLMHMHAGAVKTYADLRTGHSRRFAV